MNMREKIARAMYTTHPRNKPFDLLRPEFQAKYLKQADAVLNALLEPTEGMCRAGDKILCDEIVCNCDEEEIFRAMIQAAKDGE